MTNSSTCAACFPDSIKLDPTKAPNINTLGAKEWILATCFMSIPGLVLCPILAFSILAKKRLKTTANILIAVMAATDFANSLLGTVLFSVTWSLGHYPRDKWVGHFQGEVQQVGAYVPKSLILIIYRRFRVSFTSNDHILHPWPVDL